MIEVTIDSIRVSLMSQHRIVVLKEVDVERYLVIWIGHDTAESITMELQKIAVARPMTHDLIKNVINNMGGKLSHVVISTLKNDVFYAELVVDVKGKSIDIDTRPSDALALAVRARSKIFVGESVMDKASIRPETGLDEKEKFDVDSQNEDLGAFRDFVDTLNLDDL
ncbi:MAG: hypothetical protein B6242_08920 [Anaerolineaceae bacterium 4572_78]|nr:MAG: hypothetical protein B6242_08920 [Anaerolineaceae bacterium 4572_78]